MMKTKSVSILLLAAMAVLSACNESTRASASFQAALHANYIHASTSEFVFSDPAGGGMTFEVTSQSTPWKIDNVPAWVTVSPASGSASANVSLSVSPYDRAETRIGIFSFSSASHDWSYSKTMTVRQSGVEPVLTVEKREFSFDGQSHSETVKAESNFDWAINNNGNSWISITFNGSEMTLSVTANETGKDRSGTVDIRFEGRLMTTFTVTQLAAEVSMTTDALNFENGAGSYSLTITSEAAWNIVNYNDWINVSPLSGSVGETTVTVTVPPNPRDEARDGSLFVRFANSGQQIAEIPVHQDGIVIELQDYSDAYYQNLTSLGGDFTWYLRSNTEWSIVQVPDFLTVSPLSGNGTTPLSVSFPENPTFDTHGGEFIIERTSTGYRNSYWLQQRARTYDLSQTRVECNDLAQTIYVDVETEGDWGFSNDNNFFTLSPMASRGNQRISVSVPENTDYSSREGTARFSLYGIQGYDNGIAQVADLVVYQSGWQDKYHYISQDIELTSEAGTLPVDIATNDGWSASITTDASWIRIDGPASNKGGGTLTIAYDRNPSANVRSATVRILLEHLDPVEITITQAGQAIRLGSDALYFFAKGGSTTVIVDADDAYTVTKESGDWFSVQVDYENNRFTVTAEAYDGNVERTGSIVVSLNNLESGSFSLTLPVVQTTAAGFTREGFQADRDLNIGASGGISFRVNSFTVDRNWNGGSRITIGGEGYGNDENWN